MGLAEQLRTTYKQAGKEVQKKMDSFWARHKAKAERMLKDVEAGKISAEEYQRWLRGQVFIGERWKEKLDDITQVYVDADEKARRIIGGTSKNEFIRCANQQAKDVEKKIGGGISFDIYDKHTVERLLRKDPKMLPEWKINEPKDYKWNEQRVRNQITQGIIQGEAIDDIAKRLTKDLSAGNARQMTLFARTAVTGAQNAGRIDMLHHAQDMGIVVKKKWLAAHDSRVRESHAFLDGQTVDVDEDFVTKNGNRIAFPGDPSAPPEEVYNCRCTLTYVYDVKASRENLQEKERPVSVQEAPKSEAQSTNIFGEQIDYSALGNGHKEQIEVIESLARQFKTKLKVVRVGADKGAGDVQISGTVMALSDKSIGTAIHEFAHSLTLENQTKFGLYQEGEFWKELVKIHRQYKKTVGDDTSKWISTYEHAHKGNDEFLAEAFTQAIMHENGFDLPARYGSDYTFSMQVLELVRKYFGR